VLEGTRICWETGRKTVPGCLQCKPLRTLLREKMKRKKVKACTVCKRYHKACDGDRPCARCKMNGLESACIGEIPGGDTRLTRWKRVQHENFTQAPASSKQKPFVIHNYPTARKTPRKIPGPTEISFKDFKPPFVTLWVADPSIPMLKDMTSEQETECGDPMPSLFDAPQLTTLFDECEDFDRSSETS